MEKYYLEGNGDFRSQECIEILKEADIICTNPPFSLFREYIAQLAEYDKKFIVWGNTNAVTYKNIFPLIKENKVWLGQMVNKTCVFRLSKTYSKWDEKITKQMNDGCKYGKCPAITVFTNLVFSKSYKKVYFTAKFYNDQGIPLTESNIKYPSYDNYRAINVDKVSQIPCDYFGVIGVPVTFLSQYCPFEPKLNPNNFAKYFEILDRADGNIAGEDNSYYIPGFFDKGGSPLVKGTLKYKRLLIRRKDQPTTER